MGREPIGDILRVQVPTLRAGEIIQWSTLAGTMLKRFAAGLARGCLARQQTLRSARPPRPGTRWTTRRRRPSPVPLSRVQPRPALLIDVKHEFHTAVQYSCRNPLKRTYLSWIITRW